jgi:O-antigen/teichoic acid export membrane protein
MVTQRDGNEVNLLTSSIQTTGGALVATTLYTVSGLIYAFVTSPSVTGQYFFAVLTIALVLRPIRGITQTLHKIGTEPGESVEAYLGVAVLFGVAYLSVLGVVGFTIGGYLAQMTVFDRTLLRISGVFAATTALVMTVESLVSAVGYPSAVTWINSVKSSLELGVLLILNQSIATVTELMAVMIGVRLTVFGLVAVGLRVIPALPDQHELSRAWGYAKWSIPDQILDRVSYNMPVYVLGIVSTPLAVGIYEVADRFGDFGATIAWQLSNPLLTKVSGDDAAGVAVGRYIDTVVTGGSGVSFVVFGYLLSTRELIAALAFPSAPVQFSTTVIIVGGINIFRGFWTLSSHVLEGLGHPGLSFRTKLYGLVVSVPLTAVLGVRFGALAGAVGYVVMNLVVGGYVIYYSRQVLDSTLIDTTVGLHFLVALVVESAVVYATVWGVLQVGGGPVIAAVAGIVAACIGFGVPLWVVSAPARAVFRRTYELSVDRLPH